MSDAEARDNHGRWTAGGGGEPNEAAATAHAQQIAGKYKPLVGLPQGAMKLKDGWYKPGPMARLQDAATAYMKQAGLPYNKIQTYQPADPAQGAKIAQAFDNMQHNPSDPAVKASYEALAKETLAQWQSLKATGLKVDWLKPGQADPYADTPRGAENDVSENNHWWGFPTDLGFGSDPSIKDNPMLRDSGEVIGGRHALVNDVFRVVHDMYGHIKEGNGFSPAGEDNAWRSHYAMFSPAARPAMTTETRGQSSWVNYGPRGAENRTALYGSPAPVVPGGDITHTPIYAPQKIGLLPEWAQEGAKDPSPPKALPELAPDAISARHTAFAAKYGADVSGEANKLANDWYTMHPTSHIDSYLKGALPDGLEKRTWDAIHDDTQKRLGNVDKIDVYRGIPGKEIADAVSAAKAAGASSVEIPIHDSKNHTHEAVCATGQRELAEAYAASRWARHNGDPADAHTGVVLHMKVPKSDVVFSTANSAFTNPYTPNWNEYLVRTRGAPSIKLPTSDIQVVQ